MTDIPAMLLWTDAYMADTSHLTTTEHGAYLLILMAMWRAGGALPDDETRLARTARLPLDKWRRIAPSVMEFMTVENGSVTQKRLRLEFEIASCKAQKLSNAGRAGGRAKALKNLMRVPSDARETPEAIGCDQPSGSLAIPITRNQTPVNTTSLCSVDGPAQTPKPEKQKRAKAKTAIAENAQPTETDKKKAEESGMTTATFRHEWQKFRDHHLKLASQMADWQAAWRTWVLGWQDRKSLQFVGVSAAMTGDKISDDTWRQRVKTWVSGGKRDSQWFEFYGPMPGRSGCQVPPSILVEFGLVARAKAIDQLGNPLHDDDEGFGFSAMGAA